jgi:hypothetical protein
MLLIVPRQGSERPLTAVVTGVAVPVGLSESVLRAIASAPAGRALVAAPQPRTVAEGPSRAWSRNYCILKAVVASWAPERDPRLLWAEPTCRAGPAVGLCSGSVNVAEGAKRTGPCRSVRRPLRAVITTPTLILFVACRGSDISVVASGSHQAHGSVRCPENWLPRARLTLSRHGVGAPVALWA